MYELMLGGLTDNLSAPLPLRSAQRGRVRSVLDQELEHH